MDNDDNEQPELFAEGTTPDRSRKRGSPKGKLADQKPAATMRLAPATALVIHPLVGLPADELALAYRADIDAELDRLRRNRAPAYVPHVIALEDGRSWGATNHLATLVAATERAREDEHCAIPVLELATLNGAAFFTGQMGGLLGATPYEQACTVRAITASYTSLREWMRAHELDPDKWDSKCSKVLKILALDSAILNRIDRFSITNVQQAGKVVDAWADGAKRPAMQAVLAAGAGTNERVKAGPLFKAMLDALGTPASKPGWLDEGSGGRTLVLDGKPLAQFRSGEDGWVLAGVDGAAFDEVLLRAALKASAAGSTA